MESSLRPYLHQKLVSNQERNKAGMEILVQFLGSPYIVPYVVGSFVNQFNAT
jgi:hypothetical protein